MSGALDDVYLSLKNGYPDANRRAVLVISNRGFDTNTCPSTLGAPATRAAAAHTTDKVDTYVAVFGRDQFAPDTDPPPDVPGAEMVAEAGAAPGTGAHYYDARKDKQPALDALRKIIDDLATCAYDVPMDPGATAVLSYSDPLALPGPQPAFKTIAHDGACTSDGATGNGWGYNATLKRVFVCGDACQGYRDTLRTTAAYAAQYNQPSQAVPLFSHKADCTPQ
jgi:hypothetical protein